MPEPPLEFILPPPPKGLGWADDAVAPNAVPGPAAFPNGFPLVLPVCDELELPHGLELEPKGVFEVDDEEPKGLDETDDGPPNEEAGAVTP